mmetsp:Transcript_10923/g.17880  ORF Transcript_10923/g.17880 Transcript_10923/m.17880 type:complete len:84 (+) Transcript_10923:376-627(+)
MVAHTNNNFAETICYVPGRPNDCYVLIDTEDFEPHMWDLIYLMKSLQNKRFLTPSLAGNLSFSWGLGMFTLMCNQREICIPPD